MYKLPGKLLIIIILNLHNARLQRQTPNSCFVPNSLNQKCDRNARYRTMSGVCNNINHRKRGTPGTQLVRLLPPQYKDGINEPRGGLAERNLPNPRWLSQRNHPDRDLPDNRFTHMVMQFGQFLDHDITLTPKNEEMDCCRGDDNHDPRCFVIPIPNRDRFYSWVNVTATCLNLLRSTPLCGQSVRQQFNQITSFIDASNVYGSDRETAAVLRTYKNGLLQENKLTRQLPTMEQVNVRPNTKKLRPESQTDFKAGDDRVNEHPFLTSLHIVFMREHNRIARELKKHLPKNLQTDEIIYQEARRIVAAEMQNIVYGEFLPTILGAKYIKEYGLLVEENSTYDPNVDPSIINSFSTAAFRFGHSMINSMFMLVSQIKKDKEGNNAKWFWRLREIFDGQSIRGDKLPVENMLMGLMQQMPQTCDAYFSSEVTNHLFQKNGRRENFGLDLLAMNVQRGRDHGLPGYNAYRKKCGLRGISSFKSRPAELSANYWNELKEVYDSVDDIDLMVGAVAEHTVRGGSVGPTFACIIAQQFKRLKDGDRFYYTHVNAKGLSAVAKASVLQRTLGDVVCDTTELRETQMWVTLQPNQDYNRMEKCSHKRKLSLEDMAAEIAEELGGARQGTGRRGGARGRSKTKRKPRVSRAMEFLNVLNTEAFLGA